MLLWTNIKNNIWLIVIIIVCICAIFSNVLVLKDKEVVDIPIIEVKAPTSVITAYITGYNSVPEQTDSTPCYAGSEYICGRTDVIACPRWIPKGTIVEIDMKFYECVDRLAIKYDNRFDIFCDKDFDCPYKVSGIKKVAIYLNN